MPRRRSASCRRARRPGNGRRTSRPTSIRGRASNPFPESDMRSILLIFCGGLIAVGLVLGARATAPNRIASPAFALPPDKAALGKTIREYLIANPEVLVEAMQELERKQDSQRDSQAQKAILENQSELLRDPDSPTAGN